MSVVVVCEIAIATCCMCGAPFVYLRANKRRLTCGARCRARRDNATNYQSRKANAARCKTRGLR